MVMLRLIETHCIPLLTYGIEIVHVVNRDERRQLRVYYCIITWTEENLVNEPLEGKSLNDFISIFCSVHIFMVISNLY